MNEIELCMVRQFFSPCIWRTAYCLTTQLGCTKVVICYTQYGLVYYSGLWYDAINSH